MKNVKLLIEYDGTNYSGWQKQNNGLGIQTVIEIAIEKLTKSKCDLIGAGRTDKGVHAYGMVANFKTDSTIPPEKFSYALNSILPGDIVIKNSEQVRDDFHSRYSAIGKTYKYVIYNSKFPTAINKNRVCHIREKLDLVKMIEAKRYFLGEHDFEAFTSTGSSVKSYVRTITGLEIEKNRENIHIYISGTGFLYNMVRIISGTFVEVGNGRILPDKIPEIIAGKDRSKAGKTLPPHGLYLVEVFYRV